MPTHCMIDLETLNTDPDSVILSVGACKFDPYTKIQPWAGVLWRLDINDQLAQGRTVSDSTLEWWSRQDAEIREEAFSELARITTQEFMTQLNRYLVGMDKIWCQGPQFDMVILEDLYRRNGVQKNWAYWQICDSRTVFGLMPSDPRKSIQTQLHNAQADAYYQALALQTAFAHYEFQPR